MRRTKLEEERRRWDPRMGRLEERRSPDGRRERLWRRNTTDEWTKRWDAKETRRSEDRKKSDARSKWGEKKSMSSEEDLRGAVSSKEEIRSSEEERRRSSDEMRSSDDGTQRGGKRAMRSEEEWRRSEEERRRRADEVRSMDDGTQRGEKKLDERTRRTENATGLVDMRRKMEERTRSPNDGMRRPQKRRRQPAWRRKSWAERFIRPTEEPKSMDRRLNESETKLRNLDGRTSRSNEREDSKNTIYHNRGSRGCGGSARKGENPVRKKERRSKKSRVKTLDADQDKPESGNMNQDEEPVRTRPGDRSADKELVRMMSGNGSADKELVRMMGTRNKDDGIVRSKVDANHAMSKSVNNNDSPDQQASTTLNVITSGARPKAKSSSAKDKLPARGDRKTAQIKAKSRNARRWSQCFSRVERKAAHNKTQSDLYDNSNNNVETASCSSNDDELSTIDQQEHCKLLFRVCKAQLDPDRQGGHTPMLPHATSKEPAATTPTCKNSPTPIVL